MLQFIQVGDLQDRRDKYMTKVKHKVGKDNWFWVFKLGNKLYSQTWGMQVYEDAYYFFFHKNPELLKDLVEKWSDVYVVNRHDLVSGLNYHLQNHNRDHFHDIAIRRCLTRFGLSFQGKDILNLNDSPYCHSKIPFHLIHLFKGSLKKWFDDSRYIAVAVEIEEKAKLSEMLVK